MDSIIYINDKEIEIVDWSFTVLQTCESLGISIPRFCYHRDLSIAGNCRMRMIEVKNSVKPVIACATSLSKDMRIFVNSELVKTARENVLEFLLINHPLDCPICDQAGECDLQDQTIIFGSDRGRFVEKKRSVEDKLFGPIVKTIMTRCIHCTRCIRFLDEVAGNSLLGTMGRGKDTEITTYVSKSLKSEILGNIVDLCPVGALTSKPYAFKARSWELQNMEALDVFDSLVSFIRIDVKGNEVLRILPRRNDFLNKEWISDKVRFHYEGSLLNRLVSPLIKVPYRKNKGTKYLLLCCSLTFAYSLFYQEYVRSSMEKKIMTSYVGGDLDLTESLQYREFTNALNIHSFYFDLKKKESFSDFRMNWTLNESIDDFINKESIIFLNVNLKYECSVLNVLLLQNVNESEDQLIYYIGSFFRNIYSMRHIGTNATILKLVSCGKHFFNSEILKKSIHFIESGINSLFNFSAFKYIKLFENYIKSKVSFSYIAKNSSELNILESGINTNSVHVKKVSFFYMVGNNNNKWITYPKARFSVFQAHHMPEYKLRRFNLFLPVSCFYEVGYYLNDSYWLNNQLIGSSFIDKIITSPGEAKSNYFFFDLILSLIYSKKFFRDKIVFFKKLQNLFEFSLQYLGTYKCTDILDIKSIFTQIVHNNVLFVELPSVFYKGDVFARNSVTLHSVFNDVILELKNRGFDEQY
jgi:NADH-quinone oxidoreductase chain G